MKMVYVIDLLVACAHMHIFLPHSGRAEDFTMCQCIFGESRKSILLEENGKKNPTVKIYVKLIM